MRYYKANQVKLARSFNGIVLVKGDSGTMGCKPCTRLEQRSTGTKCYPVDKIVLQLECYDKWNNDPKFRTYLKTIRANPTKYDTDAKMKKYPNLWNMYLQLEKYNNACVAEKIKCLGTTTKPDPKPQPKPDPVKETEKEETETKGFDDLLAEFDLDGKTVLMVGAGLVILALILKS